MAEFDIETKRHSCAHLMAAALKQIRPDARFGVGPAIADGFYYDFALNADERLTEADLVAVQREMRKLAKKKLRFERSEVPIDEAIERMQSDGQDYKAELLELIKTKGSTAIAKETGDDAVVAEGESTNSVSLYTLGDFVDLCRGPHVEHSGQVGHFKLRAIAGAYWRGDSNRDQLQRIYGFCFDTKDELAKAEWQREQAVLRDHRRVGKQLKLFTISDEVGSGLPLWLPNGMVIRDELERLAMLEERREGYQRVATPHITKSGLYYRSGHLPYYAEDMYSPFDIDGEEYFLRPMNCPHHHQLFLNSKWSYRDLPQRFSEYGHVYRYEPHGALSGLMRVRGFCQNDAHIYCRKDQAKEEFLKVMHLHVRYYEMFDIEEFYMRLSLPDLEKLDKYVDDPKGWTEALDILKAAMDESGLPYKEAEGEAAFYGPKVDFMIKSVLGTEYAISTNQIDFVASERFGLRYVSEDGSEQPVYVIHRAPLGSHERFVAFLIEHYGGSFPVWLAPIQAMIVPIADRHIEYCNKVREQLLAVPLNNASGGMRIDVDISNERMQKKIRNAQQAKIPYVLVVGDQEAEAGTVNVRSREGSVLGSFSVQGIADRISLEINNRTDSVEETPQESVSA